MIEFVVTYGILNFLVGMATIMVKKEISFFYLISLSLYIAFSAIGMISALVPNTELPHWYFTMFAPYTAFILIGSALYGVAEFIDEGVITDGEHLT